MVQIDFRFSQCCTDCQNNYTVQSQIWYRLTLGLASAVLIARIIILYKVDFLKLPER